MISEKRKQTSYQAMGCAIPIIVFGLPFLLFIGSGLIMNAITATGIMTRMMLFFIGMQLVGYSVFLLNQLRWYARGVYQHYVMAYWQKTEEDRINRLISSEQLSTEHNQLEDDTQMQSQKTLK